MLHSAPMHAAGADERALAHDARRLRSRTCAPMLALAVNACALRIDTARSRRRPGCSGASGCSSAAMRAYVRVRIECDQAAAGRCSGAARIEHHGGRARACPLSCAGIADWPGSSDRPGRRPTACATRSTPTAGSPRSSQPKRTASSPSVNTSTGCSAARMRAALASCRAPRRYLVLGRRGRLRRLAPESAAGRSATARAPGSGRQHLRRDIERTGRRRYTPSASTRSNFCARA